MGILCPLTLAAVWGIDWTGGGSGETVPLFWVRDWLLRGHRADEGQEASSREGANPSNGLAHSLRKRKDHGAEKLAAGP